MGSPERRRSPDEQGQKLAAPAHKNDAYEEILYGIEGVLTWTVDGTPIEVGPGQALCIPRGAVHRFDNLGSENVKQLALVTPAIRGPAYFREAAEVIAAAAGGPPDRARMVEVFRRMAWPRLLPRRPSSGRLRVRKEPMSAFRPRATAFRGRLLVRGEVADVFPLFSPEGEELWVPGWVPEYLHPDPAETKWAQGQIFRTHEEMGEAIWVVTRLDRAQHRVEYHRVEPGRYVAHISVDCRPLPSRWTEVSTAYSFIGLSEIGNGEIAAMTQQAYDAKMSRWSEWIARHLVTRGRKPESD